MDINLIREKLVKEVLESQMANPRPLSARQMVVVITLASIVDEDHVAMCSHQQLSAWTRESVRDCISNLSKVRAKGFVEAETFDKDPIRCRIVVPEFKPKKAKKAQ